MDLIQSAQNPHVKRLKALMNDAKARKDAGIYLIEGPKLALEAIQSGAKIRIAAVSPACKIREELYKARVDMLELGENAFASAAGTETPQGVILEVELPKLEMPPAASLSLGIAAEKIQDPGNLGTVLRSAWACGVDGLYFSEGCADAFGPKALRAAAGAQMHLKIETQAPIEKRLHAMKAAGLQVLALEPEAKTSLWDIDLKKPSCFVLGSEGQGLSPDTLKACTQSIRLEHPGKTESLNAGVSLSIALFEALRQRRK